MRVAHEEEKSKMEYAYRRYNRARMILPHCSGRIVYNKDGLLDMHTVDYVKDYLDEKGRTCADLLGTVYGRRYTFEEIGAYLNMPLNLPLEHYFKVDLREIDGVLYWHFPEDGIECTDMPGYYYIPEYTNYLIEKRGRVFSIVSGTHVSFHTLSTGYLGARMTDDAGTSTIVTKHALLARTFLGYHNRIAGLHVDHLDCNRMNNSLDNFEWVSLRENFRRGSLHAKAKRNGIPVAVREVPDGEIHLFDSIGKAANYLGVSASSVFQFLNNVNEDSVFKGTHLIWYEGTNGGEFTQRHQESIDRAIRSKPVISKDVVTGVVTTYVSGSDFCRKTGISRKRAFSALTAGKQVECDGLIFKYASNSDDWIK